MKNQFAFVTLGTTELKKDLFKAIKNTRSGFAKKPIGGLWACRYEPDNEGRVSAWDTWCDYEEFPGSWDEGVLFNLKSSARVYTIDSFKDFAELMKKYEYQSKEDNFFFGGFSERVLDFEALAEDFDALELTAKGQDETRWSTPYDLYGWDIPSLLVLNFDAIADQHPLVKQVA